MVSEDHSIAVLLNLSIHCPNLETLKLNGSYDLQTLNLLTGLYFPKLENLSLDYGDIEGVPVRLNPLQVARLVDNYAPMLESLTFTGNTDGEHLIGLARAAINA